MLFRSNAPGILSARWAGEHGNDKANNALLLKQLADIPDSKRICRCSDSSFYRVHQQKGQKGNENRAPVRTDKT